MESSFVIKVKFEEDTRRLTLEKAPSFADLLAHLRSLFSNLPASFTIKYFDEDEDAVTISSDLEMKEAVRIAKNNMLRLQLTALPSAFGTASNASSSTVGNPSNPFINFPSLPEILTDPNVLQTWLESFASQGVGKEKPVVNDIPDLVDLFQTMGLSKQQEQQEQQQQNTDNAQSQKNAAQLHIQQLVQRLMASPFVQQLLPQLVMAAPQLLPLLNGFSFFPQNPSQQTPFANYRNEPESEEQEVHSGVICDVCDEPISGVRYKCTTCNNYDLCAQCESRPGSHDPSHILLKIQKPVTDYGTYGRGCPYVRPRNVNSHSYAHAPAPGAWHRGNKKTAQQSGYLSRYVQDVTVPDGSSVDAGIHFVKIWKLRNEGQLAWPEGTYLEFVGGDKLSSEEEVLVPPVNPGSEIDVAVDMNAPSKPGRYVSYWRLCTSDGSRFGQRVWVDVYVHTCEKEPSPFATNVIPPCAQATQTQQMLSMEVETQTSNLGTSNKSTEALIPTVDDVTAAINTVPESLRVSGRTELMISDFSPEVQELLSMGFNDTDQLQRLVDKHDGDISKVLQALL